MVPHYSVDTISRDWTDHGRDRGKEEHPNHKGRAASIVMAIVCSFRFSSLFHESARHRPT